MHQNTIKMPKATLKRKIKKDEEDDEDDDEEVVKDDADDDDEDDDDDKPKKKKTAVKKPTLPAGEAMYDLGGKRKLTFSSYKGQRLVGIREYYDDKKTGEEKVAHFRFSEIMTVYGGTTLQYFLFLCYNSLHSEAFLRNICI